MVAISLYRGNLHRVPDVPRRWLMPTPKISLKDFRILLNRRSRALSRLHSSSTTSSIPNPNPNVKQEEDVKENDSLPPQLDPPNITITRHPKEEETLKEEEVQETLKEGEVNDRKESEGGDGSDASPDEKSPPEVPQTATNPVDAIANSQGEKSPERLEKPNLECQTNNKVDALSDKERRKKEVEDKLQILNAKKHSLVQVLKQILNAEEELKRRNSTQGIGIRPCIPLQVDATNDSGSMTRLATPRTGSEGNLGGDMEGGEADDVSNHNMHSRHLLRMSSTSPSSDSPHRRPAFSVVPHTSRVNLAVVAGSPSRFAPTGHQGHPANLPTVSVSGTSYIASSPSPSPAASGSTSAFRDTRLPSPWN
ncbi:hypothetical protein CsSME_00006834 [Camellia sinensis var. sinensis]